MPGRLDGIEVPDPWRPGSFVGEARLPLVRGSRRDFRGIVGRSIDRPRFRKVLITVGFVPGSGARVSSVDCSIFGKKDRSGCAAATGLSIAG